MKEKVMQHVNPVELRPNPWNTNVVGSENEMKLDESIRKFGMFKPVVVRELPDGSLEILGGEHRAASAARIGLPVIPVFNLGKIDDTQAKQIGLVDNGRYGNDDTLQLAALLKEIGSVEELESFLPFSDQEFNSIMAAGEINLDDLDSISPLDPIGAPTPLAKTPQTTTIMRFKVQLEDADRITEVINNIIKTQGLTESDSLTNAGDALIHLINGVEND